MSSVDDRIVNMQFNNKQFVQGAAESEKSLNLLEAALGHAAKQTGLTAMAGAAQEVSNKFGAMKVAGIAAIATLASKVTSFGINMAKSLTIAPVMAGFHNYEERINAVQTILSNTQAAGVKLPQVTAALGKLNEYANKTVYNFSEMAKNIGTFTAAGVGLGASVNAIKGIANLAALSGSNSQQASTAMYQLSQALAAGQVHLQDWNSVVNAGMGGTVFQRALANTAVAMGKLNASAVKLKGPMKNVSIDGAAFRQSLTPPPGGTSWLTSGVLTKTLAQFTGDLSKAQIMAQGFNAEQAKAIMKQAKMANNAATQIKTSSQMFQALKEEVASAWSNIFATLFGNIKQAKAFFTPLHQELQNILTGPINGLNKILEHWAKMGGRDNLIDGLKNSFEAIGKIMHSLKGAWDEIFPSQSGRGLIELTYNFLKLSMALQPSKKTLHELKNIFAGLFAVIHIVLTVTGVFRQIFIGMLEGIFSSSKKSDGGVLKFLSTIGKFLVSLDKTITQGGKLNVWLRDFGKNVGQLARKGINSGVDFIKGLIGGMDFSKAQAKIEQMASKLGLNTIEGLIKGFSFSNLQAEVEKIGDNIINWIKAKLGIHSPATTMIPIGINIIAGIIKGLLQAQSIILHSLATLIGNVIKSIPNLFKGFTALDWASLFNAIMTGSMLMMTQKVMSFVDTWKGFGNNLQEIFDGTGKSMEAWQKSLKGKMIMEIAIAIGILAASLIALSFVNPKKLAVAIGAITIMFGDIAAIMKSLAAVQSDKSLAVLAASMVMISFAMIQLAAAVAIFGHMDLKTLAKGLGAMAIALGIMVLAAKSFSGIKGKLASAGASILIMSFAMTVLSGAVLAFGSMDMSTLAKGLGAMGIGLGFMVDGLKALSTNTKGVAAAGLAIAIVSASMVIMAGAVLAFGHMSIKTLAKGFIAMGIGLGMLVGALLIMSGNVEGVLAAAGAMAIMAGAMNLMVGVILTLGVAPWGVVGKGLVVVAAALAIFLLAAAAAIPLAPGLEVLSTSLLAIGAGMALAGLGMAAFGTGFALLAATGTAGVAVMIAAVQAFIGLLPAIATQMAAAFVAFIKVIANASTELRKQFGIIFRNILGVISDNIGPMVKLVVKFIGALIDGVRQLIPKLGKLVSTLITTFLEIVRKAIPRFGDIISTLIKTGLDVLTKAVPRYVNAGATIVVKVLEGLSQKVPRMLNAAGNLIVAFIKGLGDQASKIVDAAGKTILKFLDGLDQAINKYAPQIREKGLQIAKDLINGLTGGIAGNLASAVQNVIKDHMPHIDLTPWNKVAGSPLLAAQDKAKEPLTMAQIRQAVQTASQIANAIIADGDNAVLSAQKHSRKVQNKAFAEAEKARLQNQQAKKAANKAQDAQNYADNHKKDKAAQKRAKQAQHNANQQQHAANKEQKKADKAQKKADAAAQRVQDVQTFQQADLHGKGDIKNQQAEDLATKANNMLAKANTDAARARELMKTNKKAGKALQAQAQAEAKQAKKLADDAKQAAKDAKGYYADEVTARIQAMKDQAAADKKAADWQAAYDAASNQGKADMMAQKAADDAKTAADDQKAAQDLIDQANQVKGTDAELAMSYLDQADTLTQAAKDAADQAAQEKDQAQQLLDQIKQDQEQAQQDQQNQQQPTTPTTPTSTITPSSDILSMAASAVDKYTASMVQAQEAMAAQQGTIQYVQNNYSPTALSASEIYRQNKNLLSMQQVKMGAPSTP